PSVFCSVPTRRSRWSMLAEVSLSFLSRRYSMNVSPGLRSLVDMWHLEVLERVGRDLLELRDDALGELLDLRVGRRRQPTCEDVAPCPHVPGDHEPRLGGVGQHRTCGLTR